MALEEKEMFRIDRSIAEIAGMLEKTHWNDAFTWNQVKILSKYITAYLAHEGTILFYEGAYQKYMGILIKGQINIYKVDSNGKQNIIADLNPPQTFGEISLIDDGARSATAVAAETSEILVITKDKLLNLKKERPGLAFTFLMKIALMLSQRLRQTSGKLVEYLDPLDVGE